MTKSDIKQPTSASTTVVDREAIRRQIGDDLEFLGELVDSYREQRVTLLARIKQLLASGDTAEASETAHQFKGSLLTLGASAASEAAKNVELLARKGDGPQASQALSILERETDRLDRELERVLAEGLATPGN